MESHLSRNLRLFLTVVILLGQPGAGRALEEAARGKGTEAAEADRQNAIGVLERLCAAARELSSRPDADPADLNGVLAKYGYSVEGIFGFVRDGIALEPYRGALRGTRAALACRAGNALDRALLLKALLEKAGHECRIATGVLPETQAGELLKAFLGRDVKSGPLGAFRPDGKGAGRELAIRALVEKAGIPAETVEEILDRDAAKGEVFRRQALDQESRQFEFLRAELEKAGLPKAEDDAASRKELLAALAQHFWVEVKDPASGAWTDLDTAFPASKPGERRAEPAEVVTKLPEDLAHRFEFRLVYVVDAGGKSTEETLLDQTVPVADTLFDPIAFSILPGDPVPSATKLESLSPQERVGLLRKMKKFQGILRCGGRSFGSRVFDLEGNLYDVSGSGQIGAVKGLAQAGRDLGGLLGGDADERPAKSFAGLKVVVGILRPGAAPAFQTRWLLTAADTKSPEFMPPLTNWEILVQPCWIPADLAAHAILEDTTLQLEALLEVLRAGEKGAQSVDGALARELPPFARNLIPFALARQEALARIAEQLPGAVPFLGSPGVFVFSHRIVASRADGSVIGQRRIDIVENAVTFVPRDAQWVTAARAAALRQGVADSVLETSIMGSCDNPQAVQSAVTLFEDARLEGRRISVVGARDVEGLRALKLSESDITWIAGNEPENGYLVVAEAAPGSPAAWWSISSSGACLARMSGGYGSAMTERILLFAKIAGWILCGVETVLLVHSPSVAGGIGVASCIFLGTKSVAFFFMHYHGWLAWTVVALELAGGTGGLIHHFHGGE